MYPRYLKLLLIGAWSVSNVQSFAQQRQRATFLASIYRTPTLCATKTEQEQGQETLKFSANLSFTSESLADAKIEDVVEFFQKEEFRDLLLSAGGNRPVKEVQETPAIKARWELARDFFGSSLLPAECDRYLSTDALILFPGIVMTNTVVNGIKQLEDDERGLPLNLFVLVAEKRSVKGARPLVWIFNQLTGAGKNEDTEYSPPQGHVMTRTSIVGKDGSLALNVQVNCQIIVSFPAILVRILPTSKEKMEEQGSASVSKAVSKDLEVGIIAVRDAFLRWQLDKASA
jgi:hypothetical protein